MIDENEKEFEYKLIALQLLSALTLAADYLFHDRSEEWHGTEVYEIITSALMSGAKVFGNESEH